MGYKEKQQATRGIKERRQLGSSPPSQEKDVVLWIRELDITKNNKKKKKGKTRKTKIKLKKNKIRKKASTETSSKTRRHSPLFAHHRSSCNLHMTTHTSNQALYI